MSNILLIPCYTAIISWLGLIVMRIAVIDLLRRRGVYQKVGAPRQLFFSDLLPIKLLFFYDSSLSSKDRLLLKYFLIVWLLAIGSLFLTVGVAIWLDVHK